MREWRVVATRVQHLWELDVPGVGVTQSTSAWTAEEIVRDYLDCMGVVDADTAPITIVWQQGSLTQPA